jgi:hypothetical protein
MDVSILQLRPREPLMRLRIKNWRMYQHYRDRCPPWIKLHFKILHSRDWVKASDSERVLAIASMLVASQDDANDGSFEADPDYFQRVAYLRTTPDFNSLIRLGFLEKTLADDSDSKHGVTFATPETEAYKQETEGEAEIQKQPPLNCARRLMEILSLPQTPGFLRTVEASIVAEAGYSDVSPADAAQQISSHAMEFRRTGGNLDKFYFEDTKWRNSNGNGNSKAAARSDRSKQNIFEGISADARRGVASDGTERKDGAGSGTSVGVQPRAVGGTA